MATQGPLQKAIRATLRQLEVSPVTDARARLAVILAATLDADAGTATASVSRELRATLSELEGRNDGDSDDFSRILAELSAPVGNTTNRPTHARFESRSSS